MTGTGYEEWCITYLRKLGFHDIQKTKVSGDQGIDLIARRKGITYGFQCKYYSARVGNDAVQQAYAGMTYYGLDRAAVITNEEFTAAAKALAETTGVELYEKAVPEPKRHGSLLIRLASAVMLGLCLYRFKELIQAGESAGILLGADTFVLAASLCGLLGAKRYGALLAAAVCCAVGFVTFLIGTMALDVYSIGTVLLLMLVLIRMIVLKKGILAEQYQEEKAQLKEWIDESIQKLGEEVAALLSSQLGTPITVREAEKRTDGSLKFVCHSPKNIEEDLAVSAYTLNQYAKFEEEDLAFELAALDARNFTVLLKRKKRN